MRPNRESISAIIEELSIDHNSIFPGISVAWASLGKHQIFQESWPQINLTQLHTLIARGCRWESENCVFLVLIWFQFVNCSNEHKANFVEVGEENFRSIQPSIDLEWYTFNNWETIPIFLWTSFFTVVYLQKMGKNTNIFMWTSFVPWLGRLLSSPGGRWGDTLSSLRCCNWWCTLTFYCFSSESENFLYYIRRGFQS